MEESNDRYDRSVEDVKTVIKHAKLEDVELKPLTQVLYFANTFEDFKLLELDPLVMNAFQEGQRVVFRGSQDDKAVLCTDNLTFEVKEAEISNSLLLIPNLTMPDKVEQRKDINDERILEKQQILRVYHDYFELRRIKPRLRKLKNLLTPSSYSGSELEDSLKESGVILYDTHHLLELVQASEEELKHGLEELSALSLDGYWRILDFDYQFRVVSYFLNLLDENSWSVHEIPFTETEALLKDLMPMPILKHIFHEYTEMTGEMNDEGEPFYKLKEVKVCRFIAEVLLRPADKFNLKDFLQAWQGSVPEGLQTDLKQLDGLAILDLNIRPKVIWYYPESCLPEEIIERMQILFSLKEKWTLDEIRPYVERLTTEKLNVNALLTKYSRASNINGIRYYSARHGK
uniref:Sister chromatid cohesion protein DCC1 n=1 Tax=Clastoptera arizonana TaxID=38151 RepID=A0A1B6DB07_9HEMI